MSPFTGQQGSDYKTKNQIVDPEAHISFLGIRHELSHIEYERFVVNGRVFARCTRHYDEIGPYGWIYRTLFTATLIGIVVILVLALSLVLCKLGGECS